MKFPQTILKIILLHPKKYKLDNNFTKLRKIEKAKKDLKSTIKK